MASRNVQAIKDFLDSGVDVNVKNNDGETPLDVTDGDKEIIDLLRKLGGKIRPFIEQLQRVILKK